MPKTKPARNALTRQPVEVCVEGGATSPQPDDMHLCPLGCQFFSSKPMTEFSILELNLDLPGHRNKPETVQCTGTVVHCRRDKESARYRVWVHFTDLPRATRERIRCSSAKGNRLCGYCEMFD